MKLIPIKFHILYIFITLMISFFGPKVYADYNKPIVFLFIIVYLIVIYIGFFIGFHTRTKSRLKFNFRDFVNRKGLNIMKKAILISVVLSLINVAYLYSSGRISFSLSSMGGNYADYYEYYGEKKESSIFTFELLILVASAIPKFLTLSLGFFYYPKLNKKYKRFFIAFIAITVITQTISIGNQKSLGDIVIFGCIALLIKAISMSKIARKKMVKRIIISLVGLFIILSYSQYTRLASRDISINEINANMVSYAHFDLNHPVFKIFGDKAGLGMSNFVTGYLSNGYYGLSKTLEMPYEPTFGVGNSSGLTTIIDKIFGTKLYENTYLDRMERTYGIPGKRHWHTIFPWFASDFTFIGTLLLFFGFSYLYGRSWKEVLLYKNPYSLMLFSLLTVMFMFVPANNQIFHGYDYILISSFVFYQWYKNHNKFNIKNV